MLTAAQAKRFSDSPVFRATRSPYLVVDDDQCIRAANDAYLDATGRDRASLVGVPMFQAFPPNPTDEADDGAARLEKSFRLVFSRGVRHHMGVQRYDVPGREDSTSFRFKVWTPVNSPIREDGRTVAVLHHVEDATALLTPLSGRHEHGVAGSATDHRAPWDGPEWVRLAAAFNEACADNIQLRDTCEQLTVALDSNRQIGAAVGILMCSTGSAQQDAFEMLVRRSQHSNRKLRDVAAQMIQTFDGNGSPEGRGGPVR